MNKIRTERILCPVTFSNSSNRTYAYAASLAQHCGARLFAQHVVELGHLPFVDFAPTSEDYQQTCNILLAQGDEQLRGFVLSQANYEVTPECVVSNGEAADCILSVAEEKNIDLIVMGTRAMMGAHAAKGVHALRGVEEFMLGSTMMRIIQLVQRPVLVVPKLLAELAVPATPLSAINFRHIVVCTDFAFGSSRELDYGLSLAEDYNADLTVVHVVETITSMCEQDYETAFRQLKALVSATGEKASKITTIVKKGKAYEEIIRLARDSKADLVVMNVHGSKSTFSTVFGSTTYRVIQSGICPVLALQENGTR